MSSGELFLVTVGAVLLTVELPAWSPLRCLSEALSNCKQESSNCKQKTIQLWAKKLPKHNCKQEASNCKQKVASVFLWHLENYIADLVIFGNDFLPCKGGDWRNKEVPTSPHVWWCREAHPWWVLTLHSCGFQVVLHSNLCVLCLHVWALTSNFEQLGVCSPHSSRLMGGTHPDSQPRCATRCSPFVFLSRFRTGAHMLEIIALKDFWGCFRLRICIFSIALRDLIENAIRKGTSENILLICDSQLCFGPWVGIWDCSGWTNACRLFRNRDLGGSVRSTKPLCQNVLRILGRAMPEFNVLQSCVLVECVGPFLCLGAQNGFTRTTWRSWMCFRVRTRTIGVLSAHWCIYRICGAKVNFGCMQMVAMAMIPAWIPENIVELALGSSPIPRSWLVASH